jgi:transcription antitermination factor NusG
VSAALAYLPEPHPVAFRVPPMTDKFAAAEEAFRAMIRADQEARGLRPAGAFAQALRPHPANPRPWCALKVAPHMERKVAAALTDVGLAVYVPIERYRPANNWRPKTRPLLSGYVFADLPDDASLDIARANHAVRELWCRDGKAVQIPALLIGTLILLEAWRAFDRTWKPSGARPSRRKNKRGSFAESRWEHGERVKVKSGPFEGHQADILRVAREGRLEVMVALFGRAIQAEIDEEAVEKIA